MTEIAGILETIPSVFFFAYGWLLQPPQRCRLNHLTGIPVQLAHSGWRWTFGRWAMGWCNSRSTAPPGTLLKCQRTPVNAGYPSTVSIDRSRRVSIVDGTMTFITQYMVFFPSLPGVSASLASMEVSIPVPKRRLGSSSDLFRLLSSSTSEG